MTVFNDYSENGKLIGVRNEPLSPANMSRYISENGIERAQGYMDALADMLNLFGPKIWTNYKHTEGSFHPSEPSTIRRSMIPIVDLFCDQDEFLNHLSHFLSDKAAANVIDETKLRP